MFLSIASYALDISRNRAAHLLLTLKLSFIFEMRFLIAASVLLPSRKPYWLSLKKLLFL